MRLHYSDEYMALYSPTSDAIHSDGLRSSLDVKKHRITITEQYDPAMLTFFRASVIDNIKYMQQSTNDLQSVTKLKHLREQARNIYVANYLYGRGKQS